MSGSTWPGAVVAIAATCAGILAGGCGGPPSGAKTLRPPAPTRTPPPEPPRFEAGANIDGTLSANLSSAVAALHLLTARDAHDDPNLVSNVRQMHAAGVQPLIVLYGCSVTDPATRLMDNRALLLRIHQIVGNAQVWWELGNENDLQCGLTAGQYSAMWNGQIPSLHALFPGDWFGGPVTFQANASYAAYFVRHASPRPDFISWHEYTCSSADPASTCVANIAQWTTHIVATRDAIEAEGLTPPPVFITEWNYAADAGVATDDKHDNTAFITGWTAAALQTLVKNGVWANYQFDTSNALPLVGRSGSPTPQGGVFAGFWRDH